MPKSRVYTNRKRKDKASDLVLGELWCCVQGLVEDNLKNVALPLLASVDQQIHKEVAQFFVPAPRVLLLGGEERILKVRVTRLSNSGWVFLLEVRQELVCNFFGSLVSGLLGDFRKFVEVGFKNFERNLSGFGVGDAGLYDSDVPAGLDGGAALRSALGLVFT